MSFGNADRLGPPGDFSDLDYEIAQQTPPELIASFADSYHTYARYWRSVHAALQSGVLHEQQAVELFKAWGGPESIINEISTKITSRGE